MSNMNFKTKYEFKEMIERGCELCFEWKGVDYGIFPTENNQWVVCLVFTDKDSQDVYYDNIDDVMNHKIDNDRIIDICTKFTVTDRTL